jgi:hypothetical protein
LHFKLICQVCFFSPRIHQSTNASDGDKTTYYCSPLSLLSHGQPWCCGALHCPLSAASSYWTDFIVPIPNSSKGNHWEGGLKDGLQEVPKGDKWSRRHLSFPGNFCLHLRDISAFRQYSKRL